MRQSRNRNSASTFCKLSEAQPLTRLEWPVFDWGTSHQGRFETLESHVGQHGSICFSLSQEVHSEIRCYYVGRCRCELGGQCPSLFRCTCCRFMWISWDTFSRVTSCGLSSILWRVLQIQISRPLFQKLWCGPSVASLLILNKSPGSAKKHVMRATQLQKFSQSLYYGTFGRLKKCKGII